MWNVARQAVSEHTKYHFAIHYTTTEPRNPLVRTAEKPQARRRCSASPTERSLDLLLQILADDFKDVCTATDCFGNLLQETLDAIKSCRAERISAEVLFSLARGSSQAEAKRSSS